MFPRQPSFPNPDEADFNLRWFTPTVEVKLCGHATIASIHYLRQFGIIEDNSYLSFKTLSGILKCRTQNGIHSLTLPVPELKIFEGNKDEIIKALNGEKDYQSRKIPFYSG